MIVGLADEIRKNWFNIWLVLTKLLMMLTWRSRKCIDQLR